MNLLNKVALITGSSRGIGRAIALELSARGADIVINYINKQELAHQVAEEIKQKGRKAIVINANVGYLQDINKMFTSIKEEFEYLDIFIHCAVTSNFSDLLNIKERHWDFIQNVNLKSFLLCVQQAVKLMQGRKGTILGISSLGSHRYIKNYGALGVAKAGLEALIRYLAVELREYGINVNAICGGPIDTDALRAHPQYESLKNQWIKFTPARRLGRPEDISKIAAFLCSDDADWICGQTIIADGGLSLM